MFWILLFALFDLVYGSAIITSSSPKLTFFHSFITDKGEKWCFSYPFFNGELADFTCGKVPPDSADNVRWVAGVEDTFRIVGPVSDRAGGRLNLLLTSEDNGKQLNCSDTFEDEKNLHIVKFELKGDPEMEDRKDVILAGFDEHRLELVEGSYNYTYHFIPTETLTITCSKNVHSAGITRWYYSPEINDVSENSSTITLTLHDYHSGRIILCNYYKWMSERKTHGVTSTGDVASVFAYITFKPDGKVATTTPLTVSTAKSTSTTTTKKPTTRKPTPLTTPKPTPITTPKPTTKLEPNKSLANITLLPTTPKPTTPKPTTTVRTTSLQPSTTSTTLSETSDGNFKQEAEKYNIIKMNLELIPSDEGYEFFYCSTDKDFTFINKSKLVIRMEAESIIERHWCDVNNQDAIRLFNLQRNEETFKEYKGTVLESYEGSWNCTFLGYKDPKENFINRYTHKDGSKSTAYLISSCIFNVKVYYVPSPADIQVPRSTTTRQNDPVTSANEDDKHSAPSTDIGTTKLVAMTSEKPPSPPETRLSTSEKPPSPPETRLSTSEKPPSPPETRPSISEKPPSPPETRLSTSEKPPSPPETRPSISEKPPSPPETRLSTSEKPPSPPETRFSTLEKPASPPETRPSISEKPPSPPEPQPSYSVWIWSSVAGGVLVIILVFVAYKTKTKIGNKSQDDNPEEDLVYSYVGVEIMPFAQARALAAANKRLEPISFIPSLPARPRAARDSESTYAYVTACERNRM